MSQASEIMATKSTKNPGANEPHLVPLGAREIFAETFEPFCASSWPILPWFDLCSSVKSVVKMSSRKLP
jgi:hypothetical protein